MNWVLGVCQPLYYLCPFQTCGESISYGVPISGCQKAANFTVPRGRRHRQFEILWYKQKEKSELCPCPEKNDNTESLVGGS